MTTPDRIHIWIINHSASHIDIFKMVYSMRVTLKTFNQIMDNRCANREKNVQNQTAGKTKCKSKPVKKIDLRFFKANLVPVGHFQRSVNGKILPCFMVNKLDHFNFKSKVQVSAKVCILTNGRTRSERKDLSGAIEIYILLC